MFGKNKIAFVLLTCSMNLFAADNDTASIDKEMAACMNKNDSTVGMQECSEKAYQQWDKALNVVYSNLIKVMGKEKAAISALKESERNWIKFRDTELNFINKFYQSQEGTYWGTVASDMKLSLTKTRVKTLQGYVKSLSPESN